MKVKILRNTVAGGKNLYAGESCDLSAQDARILIGLGKAVEVDPKAEAKAKAKAKAAAKAK